MGNPKQHLRDLSLGLLQNLTEAVVLRMSYFYENLSVLDLGGVSLAVTDNSLQMILRHMRLLRFFNVDSCCKVNKLWLSRKLRLKLSSFRVKSSQITDSLACLLSMLVATIQSET